MFLRRKKPSALNDEELVHRLREGDSGALAALWDRYAVLLFGVAMKYLKDADRSKDLVLELFGDLAMLVGKQDILHFRPWVHTVARNRCLMLLRKPDRNTGAEALDRVADAEPDEAPDLLEHGLQHLEQALLQLNNEQHTCIRLFHLERLSYVEVADRTGLPVEHVRSHLQNGRRNLRRIMERHPRNDAP